jgi:hypothetical protein
MRVVLTIGQQIGCELRALSCRLAEGVQEFASPTRSGVVLEKRLRRADDRE